MTTVCDSTVVLPDPWDGDRGEWAYWVASGLAAATVVHAVATAVALLRAA